MLWIEVLVRRYVTEYVEIIAGRPNAMIEQALIVLLQVAEHESAIDVSHLSAVPMVHKGNLALFPVAEATAGKGGRQAGCNLFVDGKLRVVRRSVHIVVAILIVQAK